MAVEYKATESYVWYVVFTPGTQSFWWQKLLKSGFRHCYVVRGDGPGCLMVSHHGYRLDIRTFDTPAYEFALAQAGMGGYPVLEYCHEVEAVRAYRTIMTCVSTVINVIGIRGLFALTPYSLYCGLLSLGAKKVEVMT